jgi:serine/threonine protein phosphatase Stp1
MSGEVAATGFTWRSASVTSQGNVRTHNEDALLDLPAAGLWAVADGMGGHSAGDVASRMIVETLCGVTRHERPSELLDDVEDRIEAVNEQLFRKSLAGGGLCGSTVALLLAFEGYCLSVWAGDSRVYRCRAGVLSCVTRDHSEVRAMVDEGLLEAGAVGQHHAQNIITRAVGGASTLYLDLELRELEHRDRYLICSDGLYKEMADERLRAHMAANDPEGASRALLKEALGGPCSDNVSIIVVEFSRP